MIFIFKISMWMLQTYGWPISSVDLHSRFQGSRNMRWLLLERILKYWTEFMNLKIGKPHLHACMVKLDVDASISRKGLLPFYKPYKLLQRTGCGLTVWMEKVSELTSPLALLFVIHLNLEHSHTQNVIIFYFIIPKNYFISYTISFYNTPTSQLLFYSTTHKNNISTQ